MNPYLVLNIQPTATEKEIKEAYRKLSKLYHPDINGGDEEDEMFIAVKLAYEVLMDAERRAHFDKTGEFKKQAIDHELQNAIGLFQEILSHYLQSSMTSSLALDCQQVLSNRIATNEAILAQIEVEIDRIGRVKSKLKMDKDHPIMIAISEMELRANQSHAGCKAVLDNLTRIKPYFENIEYLMENRQIPQFHQQTNPYFQTQ